MEKLHLVPQVYACEFTEEVEMEMVDNGVETHYQDDSIHLDWSEAEKFPKFKKWALEKYGEDVKKYETFAVQST